MLQILDGLIGVFLLLIVLVLIRWMWFRRERRKLIISNSQNLERYDSERFPQRGERVSENDDEHDKTYHGRVIHTLRVHVTDARVDIHWQFDPKRIHSGFVLTAKCRRNDGDWQPLAFEAFEDSGLWSEALNYGESRSYLFTVKKSYRFLFGLSPNDEIPILYDQISFSVRNGRALKDRRALMEDRVALGREVKEYLRLQDELQGASPARGRRGRRTSLGNPKLSALEDRMRRESAKRDFEEAKIAEINAHPTWTVARKLEEIQRLRDAMSQMDLEED